MKKIVLYFLLIIFSVILFISAVGNNLFTFKSFESIKKTRTSSNDIITDNLKINDIKIPYDKFTNTFLYSIDKSKLGKHMLIKVSNKFDNVKVSMINKKFNIVKAEYNKTYDMVIYNNSKYFKTKIEFTNLPTFQIDTNKNINGQDYVNSKLFCINKEEMNTNYSKIKIRGASSRRYDKKSYRINLYKKNYKEEKKFEFLNMGFNDSWILDAAYTDKSKIRNILGSQIWNDINNFKRNNGNDINLNCKYVEVFINNDYRGLYILKTPVNRSNLKVNKSKIYNTGVVVKCFNYLKPSFDSEVINNIYTDTYVRYEIKYPNNSKLWRKSWSTILNKTKKFNLSDYSYDVIKNSFDIENLADFAILIDLVGNVDAFKNYYLSMNNLDSKVKMIPWDMDLCFGVKFDMENPIGSVKFNNQKTRYTYFYGRKDCDPKFNKIVATRYKQLRKEVLTDKYFDDKLNEYKILLTEAGAEKRDSRRWYEYNIEAEIEYIRDWISNRMKYMDDFIGVMKVE